MIVETTLLPTHLALVARRLNVCDPEDLAARFLETSYLAESFLKTLAIVLRTGLSNPARDIAYRQAYDLLRADGLGVWEQAIREVTNQQTAAYLPPEFQPLLAWISKKRTKNEDEWFRIALSNARQVLTLLGNEEQENNKNGTVKDLLTCLVQIRNKSKAHGAVGEDFYAAANQHYFHAVTDTLLSCPLIEWKWLHLSAKDTGRIRAISLSGTDPRHVREAEASLYAVEHSGVHFIPHQASRAYYCSELLKANRECTIFSLPNGGFTANGNSEFIDYGTGKTYKESASAFLSPPVQLPPSETEGLGGFDIQSNTFGNLPDLTESYVRRLTLEKDLTTRLLDKNHPIITLHGGGGMGKTSLAIAVAHDLADKTNPPFEHIIWFSARDIDLRPTGPSQVRPSVIDLQSVSKAFGRLFSEWGSGNDPASLAQALEKPETVSSSGILFIFDNFETMTDVRGLHKFLDEHTHLPNKSLITSRERAFVADYPIEVRGMEYEEAEQMLLQSARSLGIEGLMNDDTISKIYKYADGHAYVMRVVVGEMAKDGKYTPPDQVMGRRNDIADAVFERSFNKLSEAGRNVFLLVSNWKSNIPELGLIVVLGVRGIDAMAGIEECCRLALVNPLEIAGQIYYSVPQLGRAFGRKKFQGDPDRLVIQQDLATLQKFGVVSSLTKNETTETQLIEQFTRSCFAEITKGTEAILRADKLLETLANSWPSGWRTLARFRKNSAAEKDTIDYALRRAVEEEPYSVASWLDRASFSKENGEDHIQIACLVSAVDANPTDVNLVNDVAYELCSYVNKYLSEIPKARRGVYLASVRSHMQRISDKLDATGYSRLAWLFLLEENVSEAHKYADKGCEIDPNNQYCLRIIERLDRKTGVQSGIIIDLFPHDN